LILLGIVINNTVIQVITQYLIVLNTLIRLLMRLDEGDLLELLREELITSIKEAVRESGKLIVIKRNGNVEDFDELKILNSIKKAVQGLNISEEEVYRVFEKIIEEVLQKARSNNGRLTSKEISDIVEKVMINSMVYAVEWEEATKRYVLARIYNDVYGKGKWSKFDERDLKLTFNAIKLLEVRYLLKDPNTLRYKETPQLMFRRVARVLASIEELYGKTPEEIKRIEDEFYELMSNLKFIPNSPTLMNAGTRLGILSACFVIPVRDSMATPEGDGIYDAVRAHAIITKHGGGTGFDFSELRPEGDIVASTSGVASGPLSFMRVIDVSTDVIKQGGRRRGANMGVLHVWHADVEKFIKCKTGELKDVNLQNFNISVGVYDEFMKLALNGGEWKLVNPRKTSISPDKSCNSKFYAIVRARHSINDEWVQEVILNELDENKGAVPLEESKIITLEEALSIAEKENAIVKTVNARKLFLEMVKGAWDGGDPGLLFIDTINKRHPVWYIGKINATNPCGEVPALEWESCNLGSINLEKYVYYDENGEPHVDWKGLARDIRIAVRLLDNVIDANRYPLKQIEIATKRTRKIGLGVMGWAHMLVKLKIPYDSVDAVYLAYHLAEWIAYNAYLTSIKLAKEKGVFPAWNPKLYRPIWKTAMPLSESLKICEVYQKPSSKVLKLLSEKPQVNWGLVEELTRKHGLRNACVTSIAPTGSISIIAGTSSGIEPIFALAFIRRVSVGTFIEVNRLFLKFLKEYELDNPELIIEIAKVGSIAHIPFMPRTIRKVFRTAHDVDPIWHVLHQAIWQQWVDQGVSKTVNLRHNEPPQTVYKVYVLAWKLGCKGITVFRDRSRRRQVIYFGLKAEKERRQEEKEESISEEKSRVEKIIDNVMKQNITVVKNGTRTAAKRFRIGKEEFIAASEEYAGGCPTCDS